MPRPTPRPCPHDLRPGTTICLHCRREATLEARARVRRRVFRVTTSVSALAAVGIAVALLGVRRSAAGPVGDVILQAATRIAQPVREAVAKVPTSSQRRLGSVEAAPVAAPARPAAAPAPSPAPAIPAAAPVASAPVARVAPTSTAAPSTITPVIPEGRDDLAGAIFAERVGDTVVVHFDTPETRTRRAEKFERTVRQTLPAVYGPVADTILAAVPDGQLAAGGDLLADLPTHGIRLTAPNGAALTLWPGTRPGEDGPLVVTYRVAPTR